MDADELTHRVRTAHGDAWQVEGRLREPYGGGATEVRGARLMASGIPTPKWNNADITSDDVDVDAMQAWYDARDIPWGVRVPLDLVFDLGEPLFEKRCAGLVPSAFTPPRDLPGLTMRPARSADLETYVHLDSAVFDGDDATLSRQWVEPALGAHGFGHWIAFAGNEPVAVAATVRSDGRAGPAAYVTGVGAVAAWRGPDVEAMVAGAAAAAAFDAGASLLHVNPDDEEMPWLRSLGFIEVPGFLVRLVRTA